MTPERWAQVQKLFNNVADMDPAQRDAYLTDACEGDTKLRGEVEAMLEFATAETGEFERVIARAAEDTITANYELKTGETVGSYRIINEIARGGMGTVYLAERDDDEFQRQVAIKVLDASVLTRNMMLRFRSERQILATLDHPNIAKLLDGGSTDKGIPYLVMEYIDGERIDEYCQHRRLSVEERLNLFREICSAVHYAHRNLIVHRDLKPSNILVTKEGAPKLLDFGIAKLLDDSVVKETVAVTRMDVRVMTPEHASPEQVRGESITTASDVYALGILLYQLLVGHRPFSMRSSSYRDVEKAICETDVKRPSTAVTDQVGDYIIGDEWSRTLGAHVTRRKLRRLLSGDLDNIILKALRKEPERRYSSVERFSEDIRRHLTGQPVLARGDSWTYRTNKFVRRHVIGLIGTAAALVGMTLLAVFYTIQLADERDRAQAEARKAEQVSEFLVDMFKLADPEETRGETVTAREMLDRGTGRIEEELADQDEIRATLLGTVGLVYESLALYDNAESLLERSLILKRSLYGDEHADVAEALSDLASVLYELGRYDEAGVLFEEALNTYRALYGDDHAMVAYALNNFGHLLHANGDYDTAEAKYREALAIYDRGNVDDPANHADTLQDLAQLLGLKAENAEAEPLLRRALEMAREIHGVDSTITMTYLHNYATLQASMGDFEGAEKSYEETMTLEVKVLGPDHPDVGATHTNMGRLYHDQGLLDRAEPHYREALRISTKTYGELHAFVAYDMMNLANLYADRREYEEAEATFEKGLAIYADTVPADHPYVASALVGYARMQFNRELPDRSKALAERAVAICDTALPADHWLGGMAQNLLGASLAVLGDTTRGEPLLVEGYEKVSAQKGPDDWRTVNSLQRLVDFYTREGNEERAQYYRSLQGAET